MKKLFLMFSFIMALAIGYGQKAPEGLFINAKPADFKAVDFNGRTVRLKDEVKKGPVVMVFYRGEWCPFCNRFLQKLQDSLQLITDKGASIIAVTPEINEGIAKTVEKTKANFTIISDVDLKIMKAFRVDYTLEESIVKRYLTAGIDVVANNGKNGANLPVPAIFILDREGKIAYRYFNTDYKKRPPVSELLKEISKIL